MSVVQSRSAVPPGGVHPAVLERRVRDLLLTGAAGLVPLAVGLGVVIAVPKPNVLLVLGAIVGVVGIVALISSSRLELTVTVLAVYLGMLDGPVKLLSGGGTTTSALRNVLIFGVGIGAILRLVVKRERIRLPPLSVWVLGLAVIVLVEAANPQTLGVLKFVGGFRQQLQWVPFFFFGYVLVRSASRFRKLFIILGVIALANGIVSTYQTRLSPGQLASWGPGYNQRIYGKVVEGKKKGGGRVYSSGGEARVRPPALGSDSGFGGGAGVVALPGTLALLALWRIRRRWIPAVLCLGTMVAIATCLGRLQVIGGVIAVIAFAALTSSLGRRMRKPVLTLLGIAALAVPLGVAFVALEGTGTFKRYEKIEISSNPAGNKLSTLGLLPHEMSVAPFGVGLGTVGAVGGLEGKTTNLLEGHSVSAETELNFVADELGLPGLMLWLGFSLQLIGLAVLRLRRIPDVEVRLSLAALAAAMIALFAMGFNGPFTASGASGPFFFFVAGIFAYWFAGPGYRQARSAERREVVRRAPALTPALGGPQV